jgi:RNA-directed DNA polymerase
MDGKQQKNRNHPTSDGLMRGETSQKQPTRGSEPDMAESETSAQGTERLLEEVLNKENLKSALKAVQKNKGAPGVDGMTVDELPEYLKHNWPKIRSQLLEGKYTPQPVRRVEIIKEGGGVRKLGVPTVLDRWIQQAVQQILQKHWDPTFSDSSYGFRPKRSAHQAVEKARSYIREGYSYVVDLDLEKFFDRVNHDVLMSRVARRIEDKRILKLTRAFLNAGVMEDGLFTASDKGVPQGGPLSPILSNLLLDDLDRELEKRDLKFVRFADDSNIYVKSMRAGERVMESITKFLENRLRLKVNREKSAVGKPSWRKFLGFSFTAGANPKIRLAPTTLKRLQTKIRQITKPTKGRSLTHNIEELARYLIGWRAYFGHCETPSILAYLDKWIRRRLRAVVWRQWKRGRKRYAELRRLNVSSSLAAQTAGSPKGPWRISTSPALGIALPNHYFASLGLPSLIRNP